MARARPPAASCSRPSVSARPPRRSSRAGRLGRGPAGPPQRLLLLFSPHGDHPARTTGRPGPRRPSTSRPAASWSRSTAQGDMIVFKGLKRDTRGRGAHERCMGSLWTGTALAPGTQEANGPSIDQIIAKSIKPTTDFESLQFGVQPYYTSDSDSTSRAGRSDGNMIYAGRQAAHPRRVRSLQDVRPPVRRRGMPPRAAAGSDPNADSAARQEARASSTSSPGEIGDVRAQRRRQGGRLQDRLPPRAGARHRAPAAGAGAEPAAPSPSPTARWTSTWTRTSPS